MSIPTIKFFIKTEGDYKTKTDESINYNKDPFYLLTGIDLKSNRDLLEEFSRDKLSSSTIIDIFTSLSNVNELIKKSKNQLDKINYNKEKLENETIQLEKDKTYYTTLLKKRQEEQFKNKSTTPTTTEQFKKELNHLKFIISQLNDDISKNNIKISRLVDKRYKLSLNEQKIKQLTREEIIIRNIEFLKNILFKNNNSNNTFNINNKKYIITSSTIIPNPNSDTSDKYYTYDKYSVQQNKNTLEAEVFKQSSVYIVFTSLTLVDYDKFIKTHANDDDDDDDDYDDDDDDDEYKFSNFITLNCEDKALLLEEQARKLDIPLFLFNDTDTSFNNNNLVKDYVIQKEFPMKADAQLKYEFKIEKRKADKYNRQHADEIAQQKYNYRKKVEQQKKIENERKRYEAKQYIGNIEYRKQIEEQKRREANRQYIKNSDYQQYRYYGGEQSKGVKKKKCHTIKKYKRVTFTKKRKH